MTIAAYRTLYESSVAFGMRKALLSEQGKLELADRNKELEGQVGQLQRQVKELQAKMEATEKREAERRAAEEKKFTDEIAFLKKTNGQLKNQLDALLAPTQKKQ
jgi:dynein light intermediate chain